MPTLLDYRRRIRSVKNTQQITRAMKFVAAAKLRRAQEGVFKARPYAKEIRRVLESAMERVTEPQHPLLEQRPEERVLALVVTSDKGLCGAFNANVVRKAAEFLRQHKGKDIRGIGVGRKAAEYLRRRRWKMAGEYTNISMRVEFRHAREIAERVAELYSTKEVDAVYALYNEFKSVMVQRLLVEKLLPLEPEAPAYIPGGGMKTMGATEELKPPDYIYEESPNEIYADLLPRYLDTEVFRVLLESAAAEHAARMTAMDSATNNAGELISDLTLEMNKIRQASITKELIEIVSGAASAAS
jgi:F-type H+-transporting ATPase subunit gamma